MPAAGPGPGRALLPGDASATIRGMGNETVRVARNTFFASVGFGVLAFQKVQVRRRELEKALEPQVEPCSASSDRSSVTTLARLRDPGDPPDRDSAG